MAGLPLTRRHLAIGWLLWGFAWYVTLGQEYLYALKQLSRYWGR
ncbi:MAG: hypothetical protein Q8M54_02120 [Desulfobaccales bacterium]|nr:hypothetical protein [Desulfobaccales bacterium]